jgi:hypothetical protein
MRSRDDTVIALGNQFRLTWPKFSRFVPYLLREHWHARKAGGLENIHMDWYSSRLLQYIRSTYNGSPSSFYDVNRSLTLMPFPLLFLSALSNLRSLLLIIMSAAVAVASAPPSLTAGLPFLCCRSRLIIACGRGKMFGDGASTPMLV